MKSIFKAQLKILKQSSTLIPAFLCCTLLSACADSVSESEPVDKNTSQLIQISDNAFSGSSVNVLSGVKQTLYTHQNTQYTGFYNKDAYLVIAKRKLDSQNWQLHTTEFTGNVNDAHNHISLVVDGEGYLHVSWDHHNNPLNYAKSKQPGSLKLIRSNMLGQQEKSVTYPQFYALSNGDILFQYRDGGSGRGTLVMNQYDVKQQKWQRLHTALIDGEGQRSAYWDMTVDQNDVLHLAWIWRETPDVATNHDLMYAQSVDQGKTWQTISGQTYQLPIRLNNSDVIKKIDQNHKLMNPPFITADESSLPYITSYWADSPTQAPAFNVVRFNGKQWQTFKGPESKQNFSLSGIGTKNPPWSRAVLLIDNRDKQDRIYLVHRDDPAKDIKIHTIDPLQPNKWQTETLYSQSFGAWEPSIDPIQWQRHHTLNMLVQDVVQLDGNDNQAADVAAKPISVLSWRVQ